MNSDIKRIDPSFRAKIDTMKNRFRFIKNPFMGDGYPFKQAIKELRKEGVKIIYDKKQCRYYNPQTISAKWNY